MFINPLSHYEPVEIEIRIEGEFDNTNDECVNKAEEKEVVVEPMCEECDVECCDLCCKDCCQPAMTADNATDALQYLAKYMTYLEEELEGERHRHDRLQDWDISRTKDFNTVKAQAADLEQKLKEVQRELELTRSFIVEHNLIWELHSFLVKER